MSEILALRQEGPEIAEHGYLMPALSIDAAIERLNMLVEFVKTVMRKDIDFGVIPGTSKPTLLKPGAEKLCTLFGLTSRFQLLERVEDWTGKDHNGEAFFYYLYRCQLYRQNILITEADASCNSFEQKYRWRQAERKCPSCGHSAIIKGKEEFGGGWLCFLKKGGCGSKFRTGDPAIESQQVGRTLNQDIYDQVNTIQKIAQKRSLVSAALLGVNASEFFTQDMEDLVFGSEWERNQATAQAKAQVSEQKSPQPNSAIFNSEEFEQKLIDRIIRLRRYEARRLGEAPADNSDLKGFNLEKLRLNCADIEARVRSLLTNRIFDLHAEITVLDPHAPKVPNLELMSISQLDSSYQAMEAHLKELQERATDKNC